MHGLGPLIYYVCWITTWRWIGLMMIHIFLRRRRFGDGSMSPDIWKMGPRKERDMHLAIPTLAYLLDMRMQICDENCFFVCDVGLYSMQPVYYKLANSVRAFHADSNQATYYLSRFKDRVFSPRVSVANHGPPITQPLLTQQPRPCFHTPQKTSALRRIQRSTSDLDNPKTNNTFGVVWLPGLSILDFSTLITITLLLDPKTTTFWTSQG